MNILTYNTCTSQRFKHKSVKSAVKNEVKYYSLSYCTKMCIVGIGNTVIIKPIV